MDGRYTVFDGNQYIVCGVASDQNNSSIDEPGFVSDTSTVAIPSIAVVDDTTDLYTNELLNDGKAEVIRVINETRFFFEGELTAGDEVCDGGANTHLEDFVEKNPFRDHTQHITGGVEIGGSAKKPAVFLRKEGDVFAAGNISQQGETFTINGAELTQRYVGNYFGDIITIGADNYGMGDNWPPYGVQQGLHYEYEEIANIFIGQQAGRYLHHSKENIVLGRGAMSAGREAKNCIAMGHDALNGVDVTRENAIAIGPEAGRGPVYHKDTVCMGYRAGYSSYETRYLTEAICIGAETNLNQGNGNICIGHQAGKYLSQYADRTVVIGHGASNNSSNPLVSGGVNIYSGGQERITVDNTGLKINGTTHRSMPELGEGVVLNAETNKLEVDKDWLLQTIRAEISNNP